jgi:FAD:protein FMN transferase
MIRERTRRIDAPAGERTRSALHVMGTVFSFDVPASASGAVAEAARWLHWVDAVFSTYRAGSDVSRLGRGEITLARCAPEVACVLSACEAIEELSGGYFSASAGGRLDPSGYVKGWAAERAAAMLTATGSGSHCVNGGGDVQCCGSRGPGGEPWRIGISDPGRPGSLLRVVSGTDFAVATSGVAERGEHIFDPHTRELARGLLSVTVVGPHLTLADAYATAAFAMGDRARDWAEALDEYEAFAVRADGGCWETSGFGAYSALPRAVQWVDEDGVAYVYLFCAITVEVFGTSLLKATDGFTKLWPTLGCLAGYAASIVLLSLSIQRGMNVGIGYAIWSGIGTAAIACIGVFFLHQRITPAQVAGIVLVIAGVVVLNLGGAH